MPIIVSVYYMYFLETELSLSNMHYRVYRFREREALRT